MFSHHIVLTKWERNNKAPGTNLKNDNTNVIKSTKMTTNTKHTEQTENTGERWQINFLKKQV